MRKDEQIIRHYNGPDHLSCVGWPQYYDAECAMSTGKCENKLNNETHFKLVKLHILLKLNT